jgi:asparagine synthase (glutamine-hydrolysing)
MCGISGLAAWRAEANLECTLERMSSTLAHRGPDDRGRWIDPDAGVALGHRRLSIIDLSPQGHQPMVSASGRFVIAYNGEVYNFNHIREELRSAGLVSAWRGESDTEVILASFDAWGVEATLAKIVGMFAIALWDRQTRTLTLARDRMGEKPLYYGLVGGRLVFASELKAVRVGAGTPLAVDRGALAQFMRFGYVPAPHSIHAGIFKLPPGQFVNLQSAARLPEPQPYWQLRQSVDSTLREELAGASDADVISRLHDRLSEAVGLQMVSDVPLGAFLSGGVDSSTIVALMQAHSPGRVRTFTIGFAEGSFDEAPYAKAVAAHLNTEHTELYVSPGMAADLIPNLGSIYDEPFADSSQVPTTLVARLTRQHVTVSLSGDGGDELFAGYPRYRLTQALWQRMDGLPRGMRETMARCLQYLSPQGWDRVLAFVPGTGPRRNLNGRRVHRLAQLLTTHSLGEMYVRLMSQWQPEEGVVLGVEPHFTLPGDWVAGDSPIEAMRRWDLGQYLPDDLLTKVDRATMSASLETRAPLLDHRVVELALAMPERVLVRAGVGKWVLRRLLDRYVPRELIERRKAGFEVPLGQWLRGPLRAWAEELLDQHRLVAQGYLDAVKVTQLWGQHRAGTFDRSLFLWNVLMFQVWLESARQPMPDETAKATISA